MDESRLRDLRKLAETATPGPWYLISFDKDRTIVLSETQKGPYVAIVGIYDEREAESIATADFIAAVNPAAILELLDEIEALQQSRDHFMSEADELHLGKLRQEGAI